MKKFFLFFFPFITLVVILIFLPYFMKPSLNNSDTRAYEYATKTLFVGDRSFLVEIADTDQLRQQGLMFRKNLPKDSGMLFIFDTLDRHGFWMKNTFVPLDIAWADEQKKIIDIAHMDPCQSADCPIYYPQKNARYALEVNRGELSAKIGDVLSF